MTLTLIALACAMAAVISAVVAGYSLHLAIKTQIDLQAMQKSTHSIQFVPADKALATNERALNDRLDNIEDEAAANLARVTTGGEL